jgi:MFS family permease
MNYRSNIWKYYALNFFRGIGGGLVVPILVLFYLDRGISLETFMILMAILNLSVFALEIPGGIIADRYSRKWSIVVGRIFFTISFGLMLITTNIPLLGIAFFLFGLGESLISGADSALLYDSLKAEDREDEFQETFGTGISIMLVTMVLGTIICGYLVSIGSLVTPMWVGFVLGMIGIVPPMLFLEPPFKQENVEAETQSRTLKSEFASHLKHTRASLRLVFADRTFLVFSFVNIAILRMHLFSDRPFLQPYLLSFDYSPETIGYLYGIFCGVSAISSKYSGKIVGAIGADERNGLIAVCLIGIVSLVGMVQAPTGVVVVVALVGINLVKGLAIPFIQTGLNRRLTSDKRASCLSMSKMGVNFLGIFLGPLFGWIADTHSLAASLSAFQWIFGPMLVAGLIMTAIGLRPAPKIKANT